MVAAAESPPYLKVPQVAEELKRTADIAVPGLAAGLVGYIRNLVLVACMGRLGTLELAGGALAIGFTNITGYSVLSGLAMGMDPLCSQAIGSGNSKLARHTLCQTILMLLLASALIGLLWANLEPLMLALRQRPDIANMAGVYCRFALPDLVASSLLHPLRIYLRSNGATWPLMWCTLFASLLHVPTAVFLSFTLRLGVPGIAISNFITNFCNVLFLVLYLFSISTISPEVDSTWAGCQWKSMNPWAAQDSIDLKLVATYEPDSDTVLTPLVSDHSSTCAVMEDWKRLLGLAIPSCLGVCLEWWWYEFMTILAGYLPSPHVALATAAIVIQTTSLMYTLPAALGASVSTRVGSELGAGRPHLARLAAIVAIGLALMGSSLGLILTTLGRQAWTRVFTSDREILDLTMAVLPVIGLCELANCPQTTSCGVLRGSARPGTGAAINFCSFYLVGAPAAVALGFVWKMGFVGLCYGLLAAQVACAVSILVVIYRTNWEIEWAKAKGLVGKFAGKDEEGPVITFV
ncbi:protein DETOXIFICATION 55 [Punica granatum]|uniref:Protein DETOXIFICATION n=2 Tax=Punica granatum TaxID=22663 RepID=A0A218WNJ7_PUNGR|nr:protein DETOXIFICATION 55 [Punica granatum]OWM74058.1 hypothetical protein CDL15_Pgr008369 [Punica granatum]PKI46332.1 hypothetical protein CRG98_033275 [Punica granatum]